MESQLVYWVLSGYGAVILYLIVEQGKNNKQVSSLGNQISALDTEITIKVATLQKTVDLVNHNLTVFLRTELDQLKEIAVDRNNGRG